MCVSLLGMRRRDDGYRLSFFFSSRRRHTRCSRDWSSDVCSSDLVAAREGTKRCILRVLQNEGDVPGRVQVGDKLHVKAQRKVSEFLQLGGRQRIRFNDGRGALVLKVPLELDGESIDLEKCRLLYSALQYFEMLEMMGVVPVYDAQSNIGPIYYLAFREPETTVSRTNELDKCLHTVKEPWRSVGRDFQTPRAQGQAVRLFN